MYEVKFSSKAKKYINKIKDKNLKIKFIDIIFDKIATNPFDAGEIKKGDLVNIYSTGFNYNGISYRISYKVNNNKIVLILIVGSHENFYNELKRYIK